MRISSSYAPMGAGVVVDGGYLVNGTWLWSSGCDHATWTFVGGPVIKDGRPVDFGSFLMPLGDYQIRDDWNVVGLKGTGSNTLVVKDVFVPRHRFLSYGAMNDGTAGGPEDQHRAGVPDALGHNASHHDLHADRRHGVRRLRRPRRAPGQARPRRLRRREGQGRSVRQGPHRRGGQRHRRGLAPAEGQPRRGVRAALRRQGGPDGVAGPRPPRPGPRHRPRHRLHRPALRGRRCHRAQQRPGAATVLARRARRAGCTPPTTPSAPTSCTATRSSGCPSATRWSKRAR